MIAGAGTATRSAYVPPWEVSMATTRCPISPGSAPLPTASTVPAASKPKTAGSGTGIGKAPARMAVSW